MFEKQKVNFLRKLYKALGLQSESAEMLRKRGVTVGKNLNNYGTIDQGHGFLVTIGDDVTISNAKILTHDASTKHWLGYSRIGRVTIGSRVFIGAGVVILPNVKIGDDVVIGAGAIVTNDIPSNSVAVGNPARVIGTLDDYIKKEKARMEHSFVGETYWKDMTDEDIKIMQEKVVDGVWAYDL